MARPPLDSSLASFTRWAMARNPSKSMGLANPTTEEGGSDETAVDAAGQSGGGHGAGKREQHDARDPGDAGRSGGEQGQAGCLARGATMRSGRTRCNCARGR